MLGLLSRFAIATTIAWSCALGATAHAQAPSYATWKQTPHKPAPSRVRHTSAEEEIPAGRMSQSAGASASEEVVYEDGGEGFDAFDGFDSEPVSMFPYGPDSLDEGAESLIPEGMWRNRGPLWYTSVAATLMQRQGPQKLPIAQELTQLIPSGVRIRTDIMTTRGLDAHFTPGMRLTVGRNLYEDILRRQHAIEFDFVGLNSWETTGLATGRVGVVQPNFVRFTDLFSHFPTQLGGFTAASRMTMNEMSSFNNYEMNYRIGKLPRPDRMAQNPDGSWMQIGTYTLVQSYLAGVRVLTFNDRFNWTSTGNDTGTEAPFSGVYNVKTNNTLVGAQFGGDLFMHANCWTLGMRSKAGIYGNLAKAASDVTIVDPAAVNGGSSGAAQATQGATAFIGDLGFVGTYRILERAYFRASYDFMWVSGLANAPEQLQYTPDLQPTIRKNGHLLFQGVSLGFDFVW